VDLIEGRGRFIYYLASVPRVGIVGWRYCFALAFSDRGSCACGILTSATCGSDTEAGGASATMDILLENMPQMIPTPFSLFDELEEEDPLELINEVYRPGMDRAVSASPCHITDFSGITAVSQARLGVAKRFMAGTDDRSAILELAMARLLERVTTTCTSLRNPNSEETNLVKFLQELAKFAKDLFTDHQTLVIARRKHDRKSNRNPETIERAWAALITNKAKLEEFSQPRQETVYSEVRRIFLPQGATLILDYWQRELNAFVSELEIVSSLIPTRGSHREFKDDTDDC
jgi:hypothetical protein